MARPYFSDLPITKKLMLIMLLTSVTAVLIASIFFAASEGVNYRSNTVSEVVTLSMDSSVTSGTEIPSNPNRKTCWAFASPLS